MVKNKFWRVMILFIFCISCLTSSLSLANNEDVDFKELKAFSSLVSDSIVKIGKKKVVVADFVDLEGKTSMLGNLLAEEFSIGIASSGQNIDVIDRPVLKIFAQKNKIQIFNDSLDYQTAQKIGSILGVDSLVTGTIVTLNDGINLMIKVIDIKTSKYVITSSKIIPKNSMINELLINNKTDENLDPTYSSEPSSSELKTINKIETNNFSFELKEIKKSGTTITIKLIVNALTKDQYLSISEGTRIFDSNGNEFTRPQRELGSHRNSSLQIIKNTPTKLTITFNNLNQDIKKITTFEIRCYNNNSKFNVQFKNITL